MGKKVFVAAVLAVIIAFPLYGHNSMSFGFDLRVGYNSCTLADFGDVYSQAFREGFGMDKDGTKLSALFIKGGDIKYFPIKNFAINFKIDLLVIENRDFFHDTNIDKDTIESTAIFNLGYFGLGPQYYFEIASMPGFLPYIGMDGGIFYHMGSYWEVTAEEGTPYYDPVYAQQKMDFTGVFFGGTVEAGVEWIFGNTLGMVLGGGYRIGKQVVDAEAKGIFVKDGLKFTEIDYSGPYVTGGVVFYFSTGNSR